MNKLTFNDLKKFLFDKQNKCVGFCFELIDANQQTHEDICFTVFKVKKNGIYSDNLWKAVVTYPNTDIIKQIYFEVHQSNASLMKIAETAIFTLKGELVYRIDKSCHHVTIINDYVDEISIL